MRLPLCVAIAWACAPIGVSWAQPSNPDFAEPVDQVNGFIRDNDFQAGRGIDHYKARLRIGTTRPSSPSATAALFVRDIDSWTSDMRILDAGAGKGVFLRGVRDRFRDQGRAVPGLVGVSAAAAEGVEPGLRDGVRHHIGWLGTDGETERDLGLGGFDRIIDVYGAAHYTPDFDKMVASYLGLLKPGGRAYIYLEMKTRYGRIQTGPAAPWRAITAIDGPAGEPAEDIVTWLEAGSGYRVELHGWTERYAANWESTFATLVLERTGKSVRIPKLGLVTFAAGRPPVRRYMVKKGFIKPPRPRPARPAADARGLHARADRSTGAAKRARPAGRPAGRKPAARQAATRLR